MAGATLRHRFYEYPHEYFGYFNDFLTGADYALADWTITTVEAGGGSATEAIDLTDGVGGVLEITNDSNDNDSDMLQSDLEVWSFSATKKLSFSARFKVLEVIQCDVILGLAITDTTPLDASDGIFFRMDDGDALLDLVIVKNGTETVVASVHTMVADTYVDVEFYYEGRGMIHIIVDGAEVATGILTNAPDDEELALTFGIRNGEATVNVLSLDYISAVQER